MRAPGPACAADAPAAAGSEHAARQQLPVVASAKLIPARIGEAATPPQPTDDANALLHQALMHHKQLEQQRVTCILRDTRCITDAMVRKQRDAQQSKLVVTAVGEQYVTNARYVQINSGMEPKIRVFPQMHALTPDECDVYSNLVERSKSGRVVVMHNHCMSEQGMIEGFRFTINAKEGSGILPIPRKMFFRHSMVECNPSPSGSVAAQAAGTSLKEDHAILSLLFKQNEVRGRLVKIMQHLHAESIGHEADFDCMPENVDSIDPVSSAAQLAGGTVTTPLSGYYNMRRNADCRNWKPEMPELLGLYHAYVKGFNKDTRQHKLFIIVSGGCHMLSDKFYNLSVDVRNSMTVEDVLESEEAYFMRRINSRSNARILNMVADAFKLKIPTITDINGYDPYSIASCTTETMINDIHRQRDGRVTVLSKCADTTRIQNGVLCSMHPSEGFWLFKGPTCTNTSLYHYGGAFGDEFKQTSLPTCMNRMHHNYSWRSKSVPHSDVCNRAVPCFVQNRPSSNIAKVDHNGNVMEQQECGVGAAAAAAGDLFTYIDEEYLHSQQMHMGWNRDNGIIELMPVAVVYQGDSDMF